MKRKQSAFAAAFLASASFAGFNIGSGFATGIEAQQFFAAWGSPYAFLGLGVALFMTAVVLVPVYLVGYKKRQDSAYNVYHYYCGDKIGTLIDWYMYISIFLILLMMMSGAGATIRQFFGIPKPVGVALLCVLSVAAALLGLKKLMHVLSYVGIVIVLFVLCATVYLRFGLGIGAMASREAADTAVSEGQLLRIGIFGHSSPIFAGIASSGMLAVSGLPWVASTGSLCENRKSALWSGLFSGVIFYAAEALFSYFNLIAFDSTAGAEVPILAALQEYLPGAAMVYSVFIILAIFSTTSGRLFIFASRFDRGNRKLHIVITVATVLAAAIGGTFIPFATISDITYTVNGCLGILLSLIIFLRTVIGFFAERKRKKA